jgi:hypothetical protein
MGKTQAELRKVWPGPGQYEPTEIITRKCISIAQKYNNEGIRYNSVDELIMCSGEIWKEQYRDAS